jgi:cell division protein ZapA (FtsZ GTPase activity inhibitor)
MAGKMQTVRVEIYDQPYNLRTDSDERYTQDLAQKVDATMRSIGDQMKSYDSVKLAVLAALHFADECHRLQERYDRLQDAVAKKASQFTEALDEGLENSRVA